MCESRFIRQGYIFQVSSCPVLVNLFPLQPQISVSSNQSVHSLLTSPINKVFKHRNAAHWTFFLYCTILTKLWRLKPPNLAPTIMLWSKFTEITFLPHLPHKELLAHIYMTVCIHCRHNWLIRWLHEWVSVQAFLIKCSVNLAWRLSFLKSGI